MVEKFRGTGFKRLAGIQLCLLLVVSSLFGVVPAQAEPLNLIANPSLETVGAGGNPASWSRNNWGANTAAFAYLSEGRTGTRSVKATVTSFTDGDAKWYFAPVGVTGGAPYAFSDYYKANVSTEVVVRYTHSGGAFSYAWLGSVAPSSDWALTTHTFIAPSTAAEATVFHLVASVGWLILDDADLRESPPPEPETNLIPNGSVEQPLAAQPSTPQGWRANKWGVNTANFAYLSEGHTGTRSVRTEVTAYTDGDAKWYFDSVPVAANTPHVFSDYYKSNVQTQLIARYTYAPDTYTYEWLGTAPAAANWQQAVFMLTPPAGVTHVSVFHIVTAVGWLVLDDANLKPAPPTNPVLNPSVETVSATDPTRPENWAKDQWGSNTATFEYLNEGHTGARSVKVTVANYVDGDGKWIFDAAALEPGQSYTFSAWYKTNTTPHVASGHFKTDGSIEYGELREPFPNADAATEWQFYEESFSVPLGTDTSTIYFFVAGNGWLQVDDLAIAEYEPVGFARPLVSMTFDDSFIDNVQTALPVMNQYGFKSTQCYGSAFVEAVEEGVPAVHTFHDGGHEICSHTVTHPFLTQLSPAEVQFELEHSQDVLEDIIGEPVTSFASPFGDYNFLVSNQIQQYYRSHRTVDEGFNSKDNFDSSRIMVKNMLVGTTLAEFQSWLDYAEATDTWLVLVYHRVTSAADIEPFDTPADQFDDQMAALAASGITVKTYGAALDELLPQLD